MKHNAWGYKNRGCRCDVCRAAASAYQREYLHRSGKARPWSEYNGERLSRADARHGFEASYNRGCRCDLCRAAATAARRSRRQRAAS